MPDQALPNPAQARGARARLLHVATASLADGDTYDTGHATVVSAAVDPRGNDAGTALNYATVTSVSGGVLTIDYANVDGTANGASQTTADTMDILAAVERE